MTRHAHVDEQLVDGVVDYDHVARRPEGDPGLLVVSGVPALKCPTCDEHWFDEAVGFELSRTLRAHEPSPGEVRTVAWLDDTG